MPSSKSKAARSTALLLALLTVTTAAVVLWLVAQTMRSERAASRHRWREAAELRLETALRKMRESWQLRMTTVTQFSELQPPEAFAAIVREGIADSAVCAGGYPALISETRDIELAKDMERLKNTRDEELISRIETALRTYEKSTIPSAQRRFLMDEYGALTGEDPSAVFPTYHAEGIALGYLAGERSAVAIPATRAILLFSEASLTEQLAKSSEDPNIKILRGDTTEISAAIDPSLPGWRAVLASPPDAGDGNRILALGLSGGLATLLLGGLTYLTWRHVQSQVRRAELQEELAASVSHELRTPVASMRLLVESLLEDEHPQKTREYLELLCRENLRLSRLIENFLTLAKLERNKSASAELITVAELIGRITPRQRLQISEEIPPVSVRADASALEVALLNLIDNACKYSPPETPVELAVVADGANVRFEVRDHGTGLSREEIARIWQPFERLRESNVPGCGLGLAIVQRIAAQAGGTVDVQSTPGQGSTFTIILPAA